MTALRTLFMLFGALAVLLLGALSTPVMAEGAASPCHDKAEASHHTPGAPTPEQPTKRMACCVACVAAPAVHPPVRATASAATEAPPSARLFVLPSGRSPAPEPGPPRPPTV